MPNRTKLHMPSRQNCVLLVSNIEAQQPSPLEDARTRAHRSIRKPRLTSAQCPTPHLQDLQPPRLVRQPDLHLHLQAARPEQRLIEHVLPVSHADEQDVVQGVDAIYLRQKLVDERVVDAGAVANAATRLPRPNARLECCEVGELG
jgi:hypothetical protein